MSKQITAKEMAFLRWKHVTPKDKADHIAKMNKARLKKLKKIRENAR
jgi:hypothetical protein